jgi:hypothetical protein
MDNIPISKFEHGDHMEASMANFRLLQIHWIGTTACRI